MRKETHRVISWHMMKWCRLKLWAVGHGPLKAMRRPLPLAMENPCALCGAPLYWAGKKGRKRPIAFDKDPVPFGMFILDLDGATKAWLKWRRIPKWAIEDNRADYLRRNRYRAHYETCPAYEPFRFKEGQRYR